MTLPNPRNPSSFAEMYERHLVEPFFGPWAEVILQRLEPAAGEGLLDVACGTGIVARLAKERLGGEARVVGVDLNPQMLAVAKAIAPNIDWREGNAGALPVGDAEKFDIVVCQQGLQFFPDKAAAVREMRRVLAPRGRLAIATWRPLTEIPLLRELHRVAERHVGAVVDRRHGFGDATSLERLLADAGFRDVRVETISRTTRVADPAVFARMNAMALVGMSAAAGVMDDAKRAEVAAVIADDSRQVLTPYTDGEELVFEIGSNVALAAN
jgi:ubiquinone/menaquinone biosynthesis C-methylase UbiE